MSLIAHYKCEETSGVTLADETGGHPATLLPNDSSAWTGGTLGATGKYGYGAMFNGTSGYAATAGAILPATADFTVCAWMSPSGSGYRDIVTQWASGQAGRWIMSLNPSSVPSLFVGGASVAAAGAVLGVGFSHVALTRVSGTYTFYINGIASGTPAANATSIYQGPLRIGSYGSGEYWSGVLDEIRIYDSDESANIVAIMNDSGSSLLLRRRRMMQCQ